MIDLSDDSLKAVELLINAEAEKLWKEYMLKHDDVFPCYELRGQYDGLLKARSIVNGFRKALLSVGKSA